MRRCRGRSRSWRRRVERCGIEAEDRSGAGATIAEVLALSSRAGVPAAALLRSEAEEARRDARSEGERKAATLSVTLMLPLGLCILPAFMLLGVAPLLISVDRLHARRHLSARPLISSTGAPPAELRTDAPDRHPAAGSPDNTGAAHPLHWEGRHVMKQWYERMRRQAALEDGAATAEYAIATLAAVGFAGVLVLILRSDEVRGMLTDLIHRALTVAG